MFFIETIIEQILTLGNKLVLVIVSFCINKKLKQIFVFELKGTGSFCFLIDL